MLIPVTLIHNPKAGFDHYPKEALIEALEKKGFRVSYCNYKKEDYEKSLQTPGKLVVIAGGDGTLVKTSRHLVGKGIPIGIIPLGTANNTATSLGISGDPEAIIASWDLANRKPLDVGVTAFKGTSNYFLESAGFGLLPRLSNEHSKDETGSTSSKEELAVARNHLLEILNDHQAQSCTITLDDEQQKGKYLLIQVMNAGYAGPHLDLAPSADPGDGMLDVVLVRESERELLAEYLTTFEEQQQYHQHFSIKRTRIVELSWSGRHFHDGIDSHKEATTGKVHIKLIHKGLEYLN